MKTPLRALSVIALILIFAGCGTVDTFKGALAGNPSDIANAAETVKQGGEVAGKVVQANKDFSPEEEYYIGRTVAATILTMYKPWDGPKANEYLNTLGLSLALAAVPPNPYNGYHFLIMDTDDINAFGAPSGFVLVSRGLLRCATSEDEVASILAHEIGHVSLKHGMSAISSARRTDALLAIAKFIASNSGVGALSDLTASFGGVIGDIVKTMVSSGYSRDQEKQADLEAIRILHDVGYDPKALVRVLTVMKTKLKPDGKDFAKTHPAPDTRIAYLNDAIKAQAATPAATPAQVKSRQTRYLAALQKI
jgi:predicted Zn-dependent protease